MNTTLLTVKATSLMLIASAVNVMVGVSDIVAEHSNMAQVFMAIGVFFSACCSVVAVLLTHHVKVIVNSRMTEMLRLASEAGISKGKLDEQRESKTR